MYTRTLITRPELKELQAQHAVTGVGRRAMVVLTVRSEDTTVTFPWSPYGYHEVVCPNAFGIQGTRKHCALAQ